MSSAISEEKLVVLTADSSNSIGYLPDTLGNLVALAALVFRALEGTLTAAGAIEGAVGS